MSGDAEQNRRRQSAADLMWATALWAAGEGRSGREPREVADQASRLFELKTAEYDVMSSEGEEGKP